MWFGRGHPIAERRAGRDHGRRWRDRIVVAAQPEPTIAMTTAILKVRRRSPHRFIGTRLDKVRGAYWTPRY